MTKRKTKKPASEAQLRARERNWNKGQIQCLKVKANQMITSKTTKASEKIFLAEIKNKLNKILTNWNK